MESEVALDHEHQFWDELQGIVSTPCSSEDLIDNALRSYLSLTTLYKDEYLRTELDVSRCSYKLLASSIFAAHGDYVRRQMIYGLLQDDDPDTLHLIVSFLLFDGRQNEVAFHMMDEEGSFPRMLELLQAQDRHIGDQGARLHRLLMELLYEMSRIQRIRIQDLVLVDDDFIQSLFNIIEDLSYDANDPYHYSVIRILLVLNEQFMISAHDPVDERSSTPLTNRVIKVLSMHGNLYKTFGENIILLINREAETSLQLLTLKLLYLIFTTPSTYEYFYTNDLHVLVDILIRNLLDLPEEASALRHTYLRVLYPLLAHTQLKSPPHYKREELKRMLNILVRGQLSGAELDREKIMHFEEVDETTRRLVNRCIAVDWMRDEDALETTVEESSAAPLPLMSISPTNTSTESSSPDTLSEPHKHSQIERLGVHHEPASSSSLSVQEVASQHEKPGIITPSRHTTTTIEPPRPKIKPLPPNPRRWRGRRTVEDPDTTNMSLKIPEEPTTTTPDSTTTTPMTASPITFDQRDSTTSSLAPPPMPVHPRRSASNPPPAVPPPRRSTHPAVQAHHVSSHCTPVTSPSRSTHTTKGQKPEPPRTRRWGRRKDSQCESNRVFDSTLCHQQQQSLDSNGNEKQRDHTEGTVSVEEAVQNVSIQENDSLGR